MENDASADQKTCRRCGQPKPIDDFGTTTAKGKTYRRAQCNACRAEFRREQMQDPAERERERAQQRDRYARTGLQKQREYVSRPDVRERRREIRQRPEVKAKESVARRRWRETDPDRARDVQYRNRYGISLQEYRALAEQQHHTCAICGCACTEETFNVDHDHTTGKVRGLLCPGCNKGLGCFKDDTAALLQAADYLIHHDTKTAADAQRGKTRAR